MKRTIEPAIGDKTKRMLTQFICELRQNHRGYVHPPELEETKELGTEKRIQELWENLKKQISEAPSNNEIPKK